jgi:hypothetical protein
MVVTAPTAVAAVVELLEIRAELLQVVTVGQGL